MTDSAEALWAKLNAETGKIRWAELQRHFARGVLIRVATGLDLVEVAVRVAEDDKQAMEGWISAGKISRPSIEQARAWSERDTSFWAVVTAPWVLVQVADETDV